MLLIFSLLTSSTLAQDISSCCTRISLSSTGDASNHQTNRLGVYQLTGILNDRPKYTTTEGNGIEHLFYLQSRNRGLWMVGPEAGQFNGGLAHRGDALCVEDVKPAQWKYTDGQSWNLDPEIKITCLDDSVSDPACEYNDQTEYQGEDLPEIFGGGGVETSTRTSAECITLCENTAGCHYWTYVQDEKINCYLKRNKGESVRRPKYVSGSDPSACSVTPPITTTTPRNIEQIADNDIEEPVYNQNEINGKFKIMMGWEEKFNDPESEEYKSLANSIENDLEDMLRKERDLSDQVESFTVKVQKLRRGSVVCDFKVNYILKEAYIAIPFAIKPANITDAMNNNFKFKKGILFQRFLIAGGSFNASSPVDHCAAKGCSHKCNYDYDVEDYICTCPRDLVLGADEKNCISEEEEEVTELYDKPKEETGTEADVESSTKPEIETSTKAEIESSTKPEIESSTKTEIELTLLPSDCMWGPWSQWGQCSITSGDCGQGSSTRSRSVVIPAKNGGQCGGQAEETEECQVPCDDDSTTAVATSDEDNKSTPVIIVADDFEDVTTPATEEDEATTENDLEEVTINDTLGRSDLEGVIDTEDVTDQSTTEKMDEVQETTVATGDDVNVVFPEEVIEPVVEETTDGAVKDSEMKQETTTGSNVETETSTAMIDDDDAFGKKLDEATTENMIAQSTMPINEDGSTDQIETETSDQIDDTETTTDAKIVYPLPETEDDTTATIAVDEEELNPVTEPDLDDTIDVETTTMKITEGEMTTEDAAIARAEVIDTTEEIDTTTQDTVKEDADEDVITMKDEMTTESAELVDEEIITKDNVMVEVTTAEDVEIDATTAPADVEPATKSIEDEPATEGEDDVVSTTTAADTKDVSLDAETTVSTIEDASEAIGDMTTAKTVDDMGEAEATTIGKRPPRIDISMETTPVDTVEETTVVIVEVPADTTEADIDSLSLVTEPAVEMAETTTKQDIEETESETESAMVKTEDSTEQEVTEVVTKTELVEIDETEVSTEPQVNETEMSTESELVEVSTEQDMVEISTELEMVEISTESEMVEDTDVSTKPADADSEVATETELIEETTEDVILATERSLDVEDASEVTDAVTVPAAETTTTDKMRVDEEPVETVSTEAPTVTVTAMSITDEEDDITVVTTIKPVDDDTSDATSDATDTTMQPITDNDQEFLCKQTEDMIDNNVPMKCKHMQGDQEKTVFLIIPAETLGDVTLDRLFDKNVKIIVKDFMIMDRSPRLL